MKMIRLSKVAMGEARFTSSILLRILLTVPLRFKEVVLIPFVAALLAKELYGVWIQTVLLRNLLVGLITLRSDMATVELTGLWMEREVLNV